MQSQIYMISNVKIGHIDLQIMWKSVMKETLQTYTICISVTEDYNRLLQETYKMCKNIIRDAEPFGEASYWELLKNI